MVHPVAAAAVVLAAVAAVVVQPVVAAAVVLAAGAAAAVQPVVAAAVVLAAGAAAAVQPVVAASDSRVRSNALSNISCRKERLLRRRSGKLHTRGTRK